MKILVPGAFFTLLLFASCKHSTDTSQRVKENFLSRLQRLDSLVVLDSFNVISNQPLVERLGRIIEDITYKKSLSNVRSQLASAIMAHKKDSLAFYRHEIDYMLPRVDSVTKLISKADTIKKYGILVVCSYQIRKKDASAKGVAFYVFNSKMNLIFSDGIDSSISQSYRELK
jgi:hypothetical protein